MEENRTTKEKREEIRVISEDEGDGLLLPLSGVYQADTMGQ